MRGAPMDRRRHCPFDGRRRSPTMVVVMMMMVVLFLGSCGTTATLLVASAIIEPQQNPNNQGFPYIYGAPGDPRASFPVTEHFARVHRPGYVPPSDGEDDDDGDDDDEDDRPDFLYDGDAIDTYRLVEFYVHWCDVCKNFRPHYIQLATRVQELSSSSSSFAKNVTVQAHAVSCAPNRPLCRAQAVQRYPVFRVYAPGDTVGVELPNSQLHPAKILAALGLEEDEDDDDNNDWDGMSAFAENGNAAHTSVSWIHWGRNYWDRMLVWLGQQGRYSHASSLAVRDKFAAKRTRDELRDDVHLSFDYAMRQGVFMSNDPLSDERAQFLMDWLLLLRQTLPPSWKSLHAAIDDLVVNFDYVRRNDDYLMAFLESNPPPKAVWSLACSHGDPDAGYSCGLWSIFHVVTVGVVDHNIGMPFEENRLKTEVVARTIRNYIHNFFGCAGCVRNFVTAFDLCAHDRCQRLLEDEVGTEDDWKELPLWLLETHNSINLRLMKELAARENWLPSPADEKAVTWPPIADCPRCWNDSEMHQANNDVLYKYLKLEYGQRDGRASEYKKEIFAKSGAEKVGAASLPTTEDAKQVDVWEPIQKVAMTIWKHLPELHKRRRSLADLEVDVHFSFDYALRHDVYELDEPLSQEERDLLWAWINVLMKTLPKQWTTLHSLFDELAANFELVAQSIDYLRSILDKFPQEYEEQRGSCTRHKHAFDQYSCGLWEMLHVLTVGVVHHNHLVAQSDEYCFFVKNVAILIRDYTTHFYDQSRFNKPIDLCGAGSCDHLAMGPGSPSDWMELPIWLFEKHNAVRAQRVVEQKSNAHEKLITQLVINARWPDIEDCEGCWLVKGKWRFSQEKIYKYLLLQYGQPSALTKGLEEELGIKARVDLVGRIQELTADSWIAKMLCGVFCRRNCAKRTEKELESDVSLAFYATMRNNVFKDDGVLSTSKQNSFKEWLFLLAKVLPHSWISIHLLLKEMIDNFVFIVKSKDYLFAVLDETAPNQTEWSSVCAENGNDSPDRLSCGMWTMLHVVSVGTVKYNQNVDQSERIATGSAALMMRNAVEMFFPDCEICRQSFTEVFQQCEHGLCDTLTMRHGEETDWVHLPLWLSRVHNSINLRLLSDAAAKEQRVLSEGDELDALWPTRMECDCCWDEDGNPKAEVTYRYLEYTYGIDDAWNPKLTNEL